jgi:uncharacterized protein (DUF433 family)
MGTAQKSLRIPTEVVKAIEDLAEILGQDFSAVAVELLTEATKMRRCPGIVFAEGPSGRRARIAGTGLDVWEVVATYKSLDGDPKRLHQAYPWLSDTQLRAALGYYAAYPDEIDRRIVLNERWTEEQLRAQHPSLTVERR